MCSWKFVIVGKPFAPDAEHHASMPEEQKQKLTYEQIEARRAKDRVRYANMIPKQRQAIRDCQNARNMKPKQKQAKRDQYVARRELRRNTLHKDSIAMVKPFYNPMVDSP
ncbi:hypothetical protein GQ55_2G155400 [Panicum hallii var. hallii]|uniref:Uncharacterized protein n=1 Tax=Panicum hallii var. hallii TaxID=1504633 RepID=A0A2T7EPV9_9POAL|nr:hypothetical protein GQ55_2G155400 [Panicum hallii var. hallii]